MLAIALLTVGVSWGYSSPVGSSPDDNFHLASIWCSATAPADQCRAGGQLADGSVYQDSLRRTVRVPLAVAVNPISCYAGRGLESAECFDDIVNSASPTTLGSSSANAGLYPSGYYEVLGLFVTSHPTRSVLAMRFASWLICTGCVALALCTARVETRRRFLLGIVVTSVPLGVFLFASVNPSAPTIAGVVSTACATQAFFEHGSARRRLAAGAVAVFGALLALSARPDAGFWLIAAVAIVTATQFHRQLWKDRRLVLPAAIAAVSAAVLLSAQFLGTATTTGLGSAQARPGSDVLFRNLTEIPGLWVGSLGTWALGSLDTPLPAICWVGVIASCAAVVLVGLRTLDGAKALALGAALSMITVYPLVLLSADGSVVGEGVQPRYLLPLLPVIVATALVGVHDRRVTFSRAQLNAIAVALTLANGAALHTNLRRYVWGLAEDGFNLDRTKEWWWPAGPGPMSIWVVGTVGFGVAVFLLMSIVDRSTCTVLAEDAAAGRGQPGVGRPRVVIVRRRSTALSPPVARGDPTLTAK